MVSVFAFYSHGPSSNTAEILCCKLFEKNEKEARDGQFLKNCSFSKIPFIANPLVESSEILNVACLNRFLD